MLSRGIDKFLVNLANQSNFSLQNLLLVSSFHTSTSVESRIKRSQRHKAFWHSRKLNKALDEPITEENKQFIQEFIDRKYSGPLKEEFSPWARGEWSERSRRPGVLAVKIGVHPLWLKDGRQILTTLLHIQDNHVVKYTSRAAYSDSYLGEKRQAASFVGTDGRKGPHITGFITVGAVSTDPQKYTKDYCGLFTQSGLMPKRHLARFPITDCGAIQPGTPLCAAHFTPGQYVDVFGRTMERGFQGVMKRWGFAGMPATHGVTKSHRRAGHIGSGADKSRVWPGQKMPGNVGGIYRWFRGLRIHRINYAENVLYVSGASVPGPIGSVLQVSDTKLPLRRWNCMKLQKEGIVGGPRFFPTAYPEDVEGMVEEEYHKLVHDFTSPTITHAVQQKK